MVIPHGQILHSMPFYRIFRFSDFPKNREIGTSENPEFRVFRNFGIPISENPDFRETENPDFQNSGLSNLRKSGFSEIRKSGFPDFRRSENPDPMKTKQSPCYPESPLILHINHLVPWLGRWPACDRLKLYTRRITMLS